MGNFPLSFSRVFSPNSPTAYGTYLVANTKVGHPRIFRVERPWGISWVRSKIRNDVDFISQLRKLIRRVTGKHEEKINSGPESYQMDRREP